MIFSDGAKNSERHALIRPIQFHRQRDAQRPSASMLCALLVVSLLGTTTPACGDGCHDDTAASYNYKPKKISPQSVKATCGSAARDKWNAFAASVEAESETFEAGMSWLVATDRDFGNGAGSGTNHQRMMAISKDNCTWFSAEMSFDADFPYRSRLKVTDRSLRLGLDTAVGVAVGHGVERYEPDNPRHALQASRVAGWAQEGARPSTSRSGVTATLITKGQTPWQPGPYIPAPGVFLDTGDKDVVMVLQRGTTPMLVYEDAMHALHQIRARSRFGTSNHVLYDKVGDRSRFIAHTVGGRLSVVPRTESGRYLYGTIFGRVPAEFYTEACSLVRIDTETGSMDEVALRFGKGQPPSPGAPGPLWLCGDSDDVYCEGADQAVNFSVDATHITARFCPQKGEDRYEVRSFPLLSFY